MFVFYHVAKRASFSSAAKQLGMSRTMITQSVEGLENSFSVRLFNRTTRTFNLTEQGEKLYEYVQRMMQEFDDVCDEFGSESVEAKGKISLQLPGVLDVPAVHEVLSSFMERNPQVSFDISTVDRVGDMATRHVDVALHVGPLVDSSLHARQIHLFDTFILGSAAYFERHGVPEHPRELELHQVFNYRHCLTGDKWIFKHPSTRKEQAFPIGRFTTVDSERQLVSFAESGRGIASALDISCVEQLNSGRLVPVLRDWTYQIPLFVVYVSKKSMPKSLRSLIDSLTEELPKALQVNVSIP